jgi:hypothetical protein
MTAAPAEVISVKILVALLSLMLLAMTSAFVTGANAEVNKSKLKEGVLSVLHEQNDAWNKGDLDKFMSGYLKSADTSYSSSGKEVWGYEALQERYVKKYGNSKDTMGKLSFSDERVFDLGSENALCIGHWHLIREGKDPLDGSFSLVLLNTKEGWKILHDHTSVLNKDA